MTSGSGVRTRLEFVNTMAKMVDRVLGVFLIDPLWTKQGLSVYTPVR